ncbi:hypothetical protein ACQPXT_34270 [Streptomyces sp. CA-100214]
MRTELTVDVDAADFETVGVGVRGLVRADEVGEIDALDHKTVDIGLFGCTLPPEDGGLSPSLYDDDQLTFEFGYTTPAVPATFESNNGIAGKLLVNTCTEKQRLPMPTHGAVASFAVTDAEANTPLTDLSVVLASTSGQRTGTKGISVFLVEAGLAAGPKDLETGRARAWTSEVSRAQHAAHRSTVSVHDREDPGRIGRLRRLRQTGRPSDRPLPLGAGGAHADGEIQKLITGRALISGAMK